MHVKLKMSGSFFSAPQELFMKVTSLVGLGALLAAVSMSSAFAQSSSQGYDPSAPKTRAQVKADLADWRAAGYDPLDWLNYPDNALRAGRIVAARRAQESGGTITQ
jgi:hypothetical protein